MAIKGAAVTVQETDGVVTGITLTDPGAGYEAIKSGMEGNTVRKTREAKELPEKINGVDVTTLSADDIFEGLRQRRQALENFDASAVKLEVKALEKEIARRMGK